MKRRLAAMILMISMLTGFLSFGSLAAGDVRIFLSPNDFSENLGTWTIAKGEAGSLNSECLKGISLAPGEKGVYEETYTKVTIPEDGEYYVYARTRDYAIYPGPRNAVIMIEGNQLPYIVGKHGVDGFAWEIAGSVTLKKGEAKFAILETSNFTRIDCLFITNVKNLYPSNDNATLIKEIGNSETIMVKDTALQGAEPATIANPATASTQAPPTGPVMTPAPVRLSLFSDIDNNYSWAKIQIEELAQNGVIKGTGKDAATAIDMYSPGANITRSEFITLIVNLLKLPQSVNSSGLSDVSDQWFAPFVMTGIENDLIDDFLLKDNMFLPDKPATREEMTSFIIKAFEKLNEKKASAGDSSFDDSGDISDWAKDYVASAVELGIIAGVGDNRFAPKDNATRAQAAVLIHRLLETKVYENTVFVSESGNDENKGSREEPVATIGKAWSMVKDLPGSAQILFREGTYYLANPINISRSDVAFKAYNNEKVTISGGKAVTGWEKHDGEIFKANVGKDVDFRQVYIGGLRATRARFPNNDDMLVFSDEKTAEGLYVDSSVPEIKNYKDTLEISTYVVWMHKRFRVSEIKTEGDKKHFIVNPLEWNTMLSGTQAQKNYKGRKYWVENAYELMDIPYEWFYDKTDGYLYVYRPEGVDLNTMQVTIPVSEGLFLAEGQVSKFIKNIEFSGIDFELSNWTRPNQYGFVDVQANSLLPIPEKNIFDAQFRHNLRKEKVQGALDFNYVDGVTIKDCTFRQLGGNGITMDLGGSNTKIEGNLFQDISSNAIEVGNDCYKPNDSNVIPKNIIIRNNYVVNTGLEYRGAIGIFVMFADTLLLEHNHIKNVPYSGINVSWGWESEKGASMDTKDMIVSRNLVEDFAMNTHDTGGIYTPNPVYGTNIIEYNYIRGNYISMMDGAVIGIYHDGHSANWTDYKNVVENVYKWSIAGSGVAPKKNIMIINNYINVPVKGAILNGENIYQKDTIATVGYDWGDEAQEIMNNAGLMPHYKKLHNSIKNEIIFNVEPRITFLKKGESKDIEIAVTNFLSYPVDLELKSHKNNKSVLGVEQKVALLPGETKKVTVNAKQEGVEGLVDDGVVAYLNGKEFLVKTGVSAENASAFDHLFTTSDAAYKEISGNWLDSTLMGFNEKSRYGSEANALAVWTPEVSGKYEVSFYTIKHSVSSQYVKVEVRHKNGTDSKIINQRETESGFVVIGEFEFTGSPEEGVYVSFGSKDEQPSVIRMSAVKFSAIE